MENAVSIHTEFITLGQLIKLLNLIKTGGMEKEFVKNHEILVNDIAENRRGRKIRSGDRVVIDKITYKVCSSEK
jgi:ribosome-associated protein